jgi:hypothetical protein
VAQWLPERYLRSTVGKISSGIQQNNVLCPLGKHHAAECHSMTVVTSTKVVMQSQQLSAEDVDVPPPFVRWFRDRCFDPNWVSEGLMRGQITTSPLSVLLAWLTALHRPYDRTLHHYWSGCCRPRRPTPFSCWWPDVEQPTFRHYHCALGAVGGIKKTLTIWENARD